MCADVTEVRKWGSSPRCLSHLLGLRVVGVRILFRNYKVHAERFPAMPLTVCPDEIVLLLSSLCVFFHFFLKLKIIFSLF